VISKIYNSSEFLFRIGKRKGKRRDWIELNSKGPGSFMVGKVGKAHTKINQHTEEIKKLTNKERLERIKNIND
tara:strand:- start:37 stop:255 length:219 start_codon:yes stop_codon:yes gene_type:complete